VEGPPLPVTARAVSVGRPTLLLGECEAEGDACGVAEVDGERGAVPVAPAEPDTRGEYETNGDAVGESDAVEVTVSPPDTVPSGVAVAAEEAAAVCDAAIEKVGAAGVALSCADALGEADPAARVAVANTDADTVFVWVADEAVETVGAAGEGVVLPDAEAAATDTVGHTVAGNTLAVTENGVVLPDAEATATDTVGHTVAGNTLAVTENVIVEVSLLSTLALPIGVALPLPLPQGLPDGSGEPLGVSLGYWVLVAHALAVTLPVTCEVGVAERGALGVSSAVPVAVAHADAPKLLLNGAVAVPEPVPQIESKALSVGGGVPLEDREGGGEEEAHPLAEGEALGEPEGAALGEVPALALAALAVGEIVTSVLPLPPAAPVAVGNALADATTALPEGVRETNRESDALPEGRVVPVGAAEGEKRAVADPALVLLVSEDGDCPADCVGKRLCVSGALKLGELEGDPLSLLPVVMVALPLAAPLADTREPVTVTDCVLLSAPEALRAEEADAQADPLPHALGVFETLVEGEALGEAEALVDLEGLGVPEPVRDGETLPEVDGVVVGQVEPLRDVVCVRDGEAQPLLDGVGKIVAE